MTSAHLIVDVLVWSHTINAQDHKRHREQETEEDPDALPYTTHYIIEQ